MTFIAGAHLAMELLLPLANASLAVVLLKATGWHSLVPALAMWALVARFDRVGSPQPYLVAAAVVAAVVVSVTFGARWRSLRLLAIIVCALSTAALQLSQR